jgi:hypothetical protein
LTVLLAAVAAFDNFTPDNDPYQERDFGTITLGGVRYFWKIDYYDRRLLYHLLTPADADLTAAF